MAKVIQPRMMLSLLKGIPLFNGMAPKVEINEASLLDYELALTSFNNSLKAWL